MNNKSNQENISPLKRALIAVEEMQQKLRKIQANKNEPIAVIGMSCRFPKANNVDEYWQNLINKVDGITEVPKERWDSDEYYSSVPSTPGKMITKYGGFIDDFDKFDSQFFGISPREAEKMDPQQRVLLEVTWEALEDAGIKLDDISSTKTGVFVGISTNDYSLVQYRNANGDYSIIDAYQGSGNSSSIAANRLSYFFNLNGPSVALDTACSSSLVSIHMAIQSLRSKESDLALAGGVGLLLSPHASITFSQAQMLAPGGRCRTFDSLADGYIRGEGAGIVLLKRLSDAERDGDDILAVIRSSAINQDGKTNGLTAPNSFSQVEVIKEVLKKARLKPEDISFIETHGTGTILGDPIEVQALGMVMRERDISNPCYLGAVKTNIGHLEAAAGIAGFIKTVLVLKNKQIPANLNFKKINPHIPIDNLPFEIPTEQIELGSNSETNYAGVSSFGFGGTNAHIILESYPEKVKNKSTELFNNVFCLSANDETSLRNYAGKYVEFLNKNQITNETDLSFSLNTGRQIFNEKLAVCYNNSSDLKEALRNFADQKESFEIIRNDSGEFDKEKIAFLFTGQGSQYFGMAREFYLSHPLFKEILDDCFNISDKYTSKSLKEIIFGEDENKELINETEFTQPALFIIEYALAKLWISWGLEPDYLVGHSIGEYSAACIAEVFDLETGIRLTSVRGKLMQDLPKTGSMAVIFAEIEVVRNLIMQIDPKLSVAGINGPNNIVISGHKKSVEEAIKFFEQNGIATRELKVSHAFHSNLMKPIIDDFKKIASNETYHNPKIPIVTNLDAKLKKGNETFNAYYWSDHILNTVRFEESIKELQGLGCNVYIEIGPHPVLIGMARKCINHENAVWISSFQRNVDNWQSISKSLADLYVSGIQINWNEYYRPFNCNRIRIPFYPFTKERFYSDPKPPLMMNDRLKTSDVRSLKGVLKKNQDTGKNELHIVDKDNNHMLTLSDIEIDSETDTIEIKNEADIDSNNPASEAKDNKELDPYEFLAYLTSESYQKRTKIISAEIKNETGKVLKLDSKRIDTKKSITHLGLDSIMAIELKNKIENKFKVAIPISDLIKGPSIVEISEFISENLIHAVKDEEFGKVKIIEGQNYRLSYGQNAMWFQHQMAPASIFNPTYAVKISGELNIEILNKAIKIVARRHPALRTTFSFFDSNPVQKIDPDIKSELVVIDVEGKTEAEIEELVKIQSDKIFEIEKGEVLRLHLFERDEESILLLAAHHIAIDYWSLAIIVNEIVLLYGSDNDESVLSPVEYSYIDFAHWQHSFLKSSKGKELSKFWKNYLSDEVTNLDLPIKNTRPPVQTFNGSSKTVTFPSEKANRLKILAEKNEATLYMVLLSLFKILLHKYTNQDNIIIGTPATGRTQSQFQNVVGYFVNPLPVRSTVDSGKIFTDLLNDIKQNLVEILKHQDYPFNLIVNDLQIDRDASRTPIFQVMFVYQKAHVLSDDGLTDLAVGMENAKIELAGVPLEQYKLEETKSILDMTMMIAETRSGITASLVYNTDLFDERLVGRFLNHYDKLIDIVIENENIKISNISLIEDTYELTRSEKYILSKSQRQDLVHKQFENYANTFPDRTALEYKNQTISYVDLNKKSNRLAHFLLNKNISKETRIGVFVERSFEMIESILAILKAGLVYVPIDTSYPKERIRKIIEDAGIKYILSEEKHETEFQSEFLDVICVDCDELVEAELPVENPQISIDPLNLAYSIYTSGSTGEPKGVMLTHLGLNNLVLNQTRLFDISSESKVLQLASLSFDASVSEIFTSLSNGATLHLVPQEILLSGPAIINELNNFNISVATIPPSLLAVLPFDKLPSLKTLVSAGELCTSEIVQKWSNGRKFINAYGPTEATVCATSYDIINPKESSAVPIGIEMDGVSVYIFDANMNLVPKGVPGELYIAGLGLARGYSNSPDITAKKFLPNPFSLHEGERLYRTGDLAKLREDGNIEFLGRIDDQVKFRGYRIELKEIRTILENHDKIKKAEVLLKDKPGNEKRLVAFYNSTDDKEISTPELKDYLREHLPDFMIPSIFVRLDKIPLTANKKVNKKALDNISFNGDVNTHFENPQSNYEKEISKIWKEVLGMDKISINDNFFDLGGHSLNVIQIQSKIKELYNKEFTIVDFFKYPTIKLFARFLSNGESSSANEEEVKNRVTKQKKLLIQQSRIRNRRSSK